MDGEASLGKMEARNPRYDRGRLLLPMEHGGLPG